MADKQHEVEQEQKPSTESKTYTADEVKALLEQETSGLKTKLEEVLGEKKTATQKARELEEAQRLAEEQRLAEKQEFKTLYEREQEAKRQLQEEHETFKQRIQKAEIRGASNSLAGELTRDSKRGELLAEKAASYARYTDNGVVYEMGGVEVDKAKVIEHLKAEYPFLVDGNGSSGGGAPGSNRGGGAATAKLSDMNDAQRLELQQTDPAAFAQLVAEAKAKRN